MTRLFSSFCVGLILLYRYLSPLKRPSCRFYPSCSSYSLILFKQTHPLYALIFSIIRVFKCNPWISGGYDYPLVRVQINRVEYGLMECSYWLIPKKTIKLPFCIAKPIKFWAYILLKDSK